jgi:hypothetical protein
MIIKLKGFFLLEIIKPTHLETKLFADIGGIVEHHFSNFLRPEKDFFQLKIIKLKHFETKLSADIGGIVEHHCLNFLLI